MLKGLAADGGLFLPEEIPVVSHWVSVLGHALFAAVMASNASASFCDPLVDNGLPLAKLERPVIH